MEYKIPKRSLPQKKTPSPPATPHPEHIKSITSLKLLYTNCCLDDKFPAANVGNFVNSENKVGLSNVLTNYNLFNGGYRLPYWKQYRGPATGFPTAPSQMISGSYTSSNPTQTQDNSLVFPRSDSLSESKSSSPYPKSTSNHESPRENEEKENSVATNTYSAWVSEYAGQIEAGKNDLPPGYKLIKTDTGFRMEEDPDYVQEDIVMEDSTSEIQSLSSRKHGNKALVESKDKKRLLKRTRDKSTTTTATTTAMIEAGGTTKKRKPSLVENESEVFDKKLLKLVSNLDRTILTLVTRYLE